MPDLIDQLTSKCGLYTGPHSHPAAAATPTEVARVSVARLPGDSGVSLDYEVLDPENGRVHAEHAMLARTVRGLALITAHNHAEVVSVLYETEAGYFPASSEEPFPMAVRLEVPEPGRLVYSWSYGRPGEELIVRDVGRLRLVAPA